MGDIIAGESQLFLEQLVDPGQNVLTSFTNVINNWPTDFPWSIFWDAILIIDPNLPSPYGEYRNFEVDGI